MAGAIRTRVTLVVVAGLLAAAAAVGLLAAGGHARALVNCDVADYSLDSEEMAFLQLINDYRAQNGLGALTISTNLNRAAHWMSNDLGTNAYFDHVDSLGRSPYQRAQDCGYPAGAGENLAAGSQWDTAQEAFDAWKSSPGHNSNMLGSYYQQIGIARVNVPGSPYGWYWTTNFGATNDGTGGGGGAAPTNTPTPTATNTTAPPTATSTPVVPAATSTPVPTQPSGGATSTPTPSPTPTQSGGNATRTPTPTPTATNTPKAAATPSPTPTSTAPAGSLPLVPGGPNLVAWPGQSQRPADALAQIAGTIDIVYRWDPATRSWERYAPGRPWYVNNLAQLVQGEAYWVITK